MSEMLMDQEPKFPWWDIVHIIGAEDGDEDEEETEEETETETEENDEESDDEDEDEELTKAQEENRKLKEALRKERKLRRAAQKGKKTTPAPKKKAAAKAADDEEDEEVTKAKETASKLAARLVTEKVNGVVGRMARDMKFVDEEDAIRLLDHDDLDWEQDDDDPTKVKVDRDSVKEALEELAEKKPHLIRPETNDEEEDEDEGEKPRLRTSKVGSGRRKKKTELNKDELEERYPALRGR